MDNNQYSQCYGSLNGGIIFASNSSIITDKRSSYYENAGYNGGVFYIKDKSQINITDCIIEDNYANQGSVAVIDQYSSLNLNESTKIIDNTAFDFATIYALSLSYFSIQGTLIQNN